MGMPGISISMSMFTVTWVENWSPAFSDQAWSGAVWVSWALIEPAATIAANTVAATLFTWVSSVVG